MLSLNARGGGVEEPWSYVNLICQTLISHGSPYLLGGVDGGWAGRQESGGGVKEG